MFIKLEIVWKSCFVCKNLQISEQSSSRLRGNLKVALISRVYIRFLAPRRGPIVSAMYEVNYYGFYIKEKNKSTNIKMEKWL